MKLKHIAVIGGGITGLTAAYELHKQFESSGQPVQITLLEKSDRLGGVIQTLHRDGFIIEQGPDAFLSRKTAVLHLSDELGLTGDLTGLAPTASKSFICLKGKLHPVPAGLSMGIPTRVKPFIGTRLLSFPGKVRASLDFLLPRKSTPGDESIGSLIERRLGAEVADRLVGPILGGIYAGDLHMLSTAATFPQLLHMEKEHRSLILGMLSSRSKKPSPAPDAAVSQLPPHLRSSMFLTYKSGLRTLVDRLAAVLTKSGTFISMNSPVQSILRQQENYKIVFSGHSALKVDGIVLAAPAEQAARLIQGAPQPLTERLGQIPSTSVANIVMAFDQAALDRSLQGSGFVVPRQEGLLITACTWTSSKWTHTAPPGKVLIRAYTGHWGDQSHEELDDSELEKRVKKELGAILGLAAAPLFTEIIRHTGAMSQYSVGHMDRLQHIERQLQEQFPHLVVAGRSYRGVGIPDCIAQGRQAAERLFQQLLTNS